MGSTRHMLRTGQRTSFQEYTGGSSGTTPEEAIGLAAAVSRAGPDGGPLLGGNGHDNGLGFGNVAPQHHTLNRHAALTISIRKA